MRHGTRRVSYGLAGLDTYTCMYSMYIISYIHVYVHACIHTCTYMYVCTRVYIYIYVHMRAASFYRDCKAVYEGSQGLFRGSCLAPSKGYEVFAGLIQQGRRTY